MTGAGRGLGKAIALELAAEGASLIINARSVPALQEVQSEIRAMGRQCEIAAGDLSDPETTDRIIRELIDDLHTSVPVQEGGRVFYPGELELGTRKENREKGIPVNDEVWNIIRSK